MSVPHVRGIPQQVGEASAAKGAGTIPQAFALYMSLARDRLVPGRPWLQWRAKPKHHATHHVFDQNGNPAQFWNNGDESATQQRRKDSTRVGAPSSFDAKRGSRHKRGSRRPLSTGGKLDSKLSRSPHSVHRCINPTTVSIKGRSLLNVPQSKPSTFLAQSDENIVDDRDKSCCIVL